MKARYNQAVCDLYAAKKAIRQASTPEELTLAKLAHQAAYEEILATSSSQLPNRKQP